MYVYLGGQRLRLDPHASVGKGGEADVYKIAGGRAVKVYKPPDHPDYEGSPIEQQGAGERLATHQRKLPELLRLCNRLPAHVVAPQELAFASPSGGAIVGYAMPLVANANVLLQYADQEFRRNGVDPNSVIQLFRSSLHPTVGAVHTAGFVIGDFNDLNILVAGEETFLIDADSMQFGPFLTRVFTERFVDPTLCDPKLDKLMLVRPHTKESDWYAYAIMLMQCLIFVHPFVGVYKPKDPKQRIPLSARALKRITVFHPEVIYPKTALPYGRLPDDLLQYLHEVFEKNRRGEFPLPLLEQLRWTTCIQCGAEHARALCPECSKAAPAAVKEITRVRGTVAATTFFRTSGTILYATMQAGKLRFVAHENGAFKREDGSIVLRGDRQPDFRYRICGAMTLVGQESRLIRISPGQQPGVTIVDQFGTLPVFDANVHKVVWVEHGRLMRDGQLGPELVGSVLEGQTLFWLGPKFGFGFYRAGTLNVAFVFPAESGMLNDGVKLPNFRGQLVDAHCVFSNNAAFFFASMQDGGVIVNRCFMIRPDGRVEATAEAKAGDGSWLATVRGHCTAGMFLLAATDDGIVKVEAANGALRVTKEFPDTEPFVDGNSQLHPGTDGLYVVDRKEIQLLKIH